MTEFSVMPLSKQEALDSINSDVELILNAPGISFEDRIESATRVGAEGFYDFDTRKNPIVAQLNTFIFRQIVDGDIEVKVAEDLRGTIYANHRRPIFMWELEPDAERPYDLPYRARLLGKRTLHSALAAYSAYAGGPNHTLYRAYGIKKS